MSLPMARNADAKCITFQRLHADPYTGQVLMPNSTGHPIRKIRVTRLWE
jgi:hypothetical protein